MKILNRYKDMIISKLMDIVMQRIIKEKNIDIIREKLLTDEKVIRRVFFDNAMHFISEAGIRGDYLEFGVYKGSSFIEMYHLSVKYLQNNMKFYAFDSFQGLPPIKGVDSLEDSRYKENQYSCSQNIFKQNLIQNHVKLDRTEIISGWYDDILNDKTKKGLKTSKASLILIDCDLYESTKHVLDFITSYIQDGTILIFDDYYSYRGRLDRGEPKAFSEWLNNNPEITAVEHQKAGRTMASFILNIDTKKYNTYIN